MNKTNSKNMAFCGTSNRIITSAIHFYKLIFYRKKKVIKPNAINGRISHASFFVFNKLANLLSLKI